MHRTLRSARPAAALALTLGVALVLPGAAFAGTTEPTPVTTSTGATTTTTTTTQPTGSATSPATTTTTTSSESITTPATGEPTADPSTMSSTTTSLTETAPSATTGTATKSKLAAPLEQVPFGAPQHLAALVPGTPSQQAGYAAGFIVRTLAARDDHYNYPASAFFDGGNTIDAVLGLDGAGVGLDQADATTDYLAGHVNDYVGYPDPANPSTPETYAGPLGKLVIGVVAQGADPTAFGGQDLVTRLEGLMTVDGRFSDKSNFGDPTNPAGDYSNTIGQALDIIALGRATGTVPHVAGDYLLDQQCTDGGFRGNLDVADAACTTDADATAFAAQTLVGLLGPDDPATVDALNWLASHQAANGGFLNQDGQYNANTAAVAAQAFAAGGLTTELTRAQGFIASLQFDCSFATALRGGIAFTAADYATLKATPGNTAALDRALRATPQATLGLAGDSLLTVTAEGSAATAPTLSCATTTTTTSPASSTTTATVADPASATPGELAFTGSNVAALTMLGAMLLLGGVGAIVLARRKGVHA
jgi:hypothetical protein